MLRSVANETSAESLRLYSPDNALLFSSLDARRPGYERAVELARAAGFEPVIRLAGGHAAVFLESSVAFAWATADADAHLHIQSRFECLTRWIVAALESLGLDARVGEVPGVIRGGAHVGGVLTVAQSDALRSVLVPIYDALELDFRPETAGGIAEFDQNLTPEHVIEALVEVLRSEGHVIEEKIV